MTDAQETRLEELEATTDRTSEEEAVRVALLELDERAEALEAAKATVVPPVQDPVAVAQSAVDVAQKAVDDAEAALAAVPAV